MSFNRRGGDRSRDHSGRPDRRGPPDWRPRERPERDRFERPPDRNRFERPPDRDRPPRRFERDEGGMSIRLDPRRLSALKRLAAESDMRPGELVLRWVEERLDAERPGGPQAPGAGATGTSQLTSRLDELASRVARLEAAGTGVSETPARGTPPEPTGEAVAGDGGGAAGEATDGDAGAAPTSPRRRAKTGRARGATNGDQPRVALHDEIIAVVAERGPMTAAELATAITERGRYVPPRSGKALDATTISARVSNPTYRGRFRRRDGRIGLADTD